MRWVTLALGIAVVAVQADLWLGRDNMPQVIGLRGELAAQQAANEAARARNARAQAEVDDLKEGLEMVEEKARAELGMIRPDEILVQVTPRR
jgi:cell division protein FtsB